MDHLTPSQERSLRRAEAIRWASEWTNDARSVDKDLFGEKEAGEGHTGVSSTTADTKAGKESPAKDDSKESSQKADGK